MSMNNKSLLLLQQTLLLADFPSDSEDTPEGTNSESTDSLTVNSMHFATSSI